MSAQFLEAAGKLTGIKVYKHEQNSERFSLT